MRHKHISHIIIYWESVDHILAVYALCAYCLAIVVWEIGICACRTVEYMDILAAIYDNTVSAHHLIFHLAVGRSSICHIMSEFDCVRMFVFICACFAG